MKLVASTPGLTGVLVASFWMYLTTTALAHKPSDSYLTFRATPARLEGEWHLALRDLEDAIGLDANDDGAITWSELRARERELVAYASSRLHLRVDDQPTQFRVVKLLVDRHSDGAYAVLRFVLDGAPPRHGFEARYEALFDIDPLHRGLARFECQGRSTLAIFSPAQPTHQFAVDALPTASLAAFLQTGIWHIWIGYDHILFLLALLLPAVMRRETLLDRGPAERANPARWQPVTRLRPALLRVLKVVTAFTAAHSLTLSLATLGVLQMPSRFVESAIAVSVLLAALNNLHPIFQDSAWRMAFGFGLLHGFGFASVLGDLGLSRGLLARALVGFNCGVEVGQLAIVAVFVPLAYAWRKSWFYQRLTFQLGSLAIALLASVWLAERALNTRW